jgi:hypothetical protein
VDQLEPVELLVEGQVMVVDGAFDDPVPAQLRTVDEIPQVVVLGRHQAGVEDVLDLEDGELGLPG